MNSQQIWEIFLRQFVQLSVVIAAVGVLARPFRRWSHLVYALWLLALVKSLTPPIWSSPTGVFSWMESQQVVLAHAAQPAQPLLLEHPTPPSPMATRAQLPVAPPMIESSPPVRFAWSFSQIALAIWASGACVTLLAILAHYQVIRRRIEKHSIRPPGELVNMVEQLRQSLGLRRGIRLRVCREPIGPAVFGMLRPMLVIPASILQDNSLSQIRTVMAHEIVHLRRSDPLATAMQLLSQAIWWFHPLAWWMNRQIVRVRELCCDAEVVASLQCPPADYAQMLVNILRLRRTSQAGMFSMGVRPVHVTTQRLQQVMAGSRWSGRRTLGRRALVSLVGLLILPGAAMVRGGVDSGTPPVPSNVRWDGYPRLAPFDALRWNGQIPQVRVRGTWYELQAVNDVRVSDIFAYSHQLNPSLAQKHFGEDLVELLTLMGHQPGNTVTLSVKDLASGRDQTLKDMPMTAENRQAILEADLDDINAKGDENAFVIRAATAAFVPRHFVRVVVDVGGLTCQGAKIKLDELPGALMEAADPAHTVLELAVASDNVTVGQFDQVQAVAINAVRRLGFSYLSYIGKQDAFSRGSPDQLVWSDDNGSVPEVEPPSVMPPLTPVPVSRLTHDVKFQIGESGFHPGDNITITEVRGTSDQIAVDGTYQVTGTYTLASRDHATLALSLMSKDAKNAVGNWGKSQIINITRGSGAFTLTERLPCEGFPHISFYGDASSFGEIYFGTGDWVSY